MTVAEPTPLREEWKKLYSETLPALARTKDKSQPKWPVDLDHCFARIILDNTIGEGTQQWDKVIRKPAIEHMTHAQIRNAIELGQDIEEGRIDLCELDQISLACRGKNQGKHGDNSSGGESKRKRNADGPKAGDEDEPAKAPKRQSTLSFSGATSGPDHDSPLKSNGRDQAEDQEYAKTLGRIRNHPTLTPHRKRLYTILLSVPRGRYTTYAAMSDYLHSSARAVGSGMRNNPFAPEVPCHRCLAADGSIGGFKGDWGVQGKHANKKLALLREEGLRFDGKGKVVGGPFRKFHEFEYLDGEKVS